jgi:thiol-disulfide isomerase/thioredoxin
MLSSIITALVVSLVVVIVGIVGYYMGTGRMPGAKLIQQAPPIETGTIDEGQANFMFFHAAWCPHCVQAQPKWASFKQMVQNSKYTYGNNRITFEDIPDTNKGKVALYQIKGFPTFKVQTKDKLFEMATVPSVENFRAFLTEALGPEKGA